MRKRLWLTICLMDIQSSFGFASQPLIPLEEVISSSRLPAHIDDSDFDLTTEYHVVDKEGLTDTTFSIITYKLQLMGRLTNFGNPKYANSEDTSPPLADIQVRHRHVMQFEEDVLRLVRFCDPESSKYAWFTFHSTQCFVAGARACVLRPLQRLPVGSQPPPKRKNGDTKLLRLATQNLEKAVLMHSDPRGEGFRWYVGVQWHALAITLAECYICTDKQLVCSVWPIVEAAYQLHYDLATAEGGNVSKPLQKLFQRTQQKVTPIINAARGREIAGDIGPTTLDTQVRDPKLSIMLNEGPSWLSKEVPCVFRTGLSSDTSETLISGVGQNSVLSVLGEQLRFSTPTIATCSATADEAIVEPSWIWDEFVSDISFDDFPDPDMFFGGQGTNR